MTPPMARAANAPTLMRLTMRDALSRRPVGERFVFRLQPRERELTGVEVLLGLVPLGLVDRLFLQPLARLAELVEDALGEGERVGLELGVGFEDLFELCDRVGL